MDSFDTRYGRNASSNTKSGSVDSEVKKLLRKSGKVTSSEFMKLRSLYKDEDLVNKIQSAYLETQGNITKKAKKFAQLIREKYSDSQTPFHLLLEKAYKYKVKYDLNDEEFAEFQRIYEQELVGIKSNEVIQPFTNIQKLLGGVTLDRGFSAKINDSDAKYLQEIVKLHDSSTGLHAQVLLQAMQYNDLDFEALSGLYDRNLHQVGEHIHPVVAALFLPKLPVVENYLLFSNIAGIVKKRYNGENFTTRPDYELFYALSTDPNDVVCDNKSTLSDLLTRAKVQVQLWNNVAHLRNGQYYNASFKDFVGSVDSCRLNKQDTPDLVYGRFDGVIIKRLLAAFSFRPTTVSTTPIIMNSVAFNPYSSNVRPTVTSVPMINMRLPPSSKGVRQSTQGAVGGAGDETIALTDALHQVQFYIENGQIVPRDTTLIWTNGVLVFYVDRRATTITIQDNLLPFTMSGLPAPIAGFEKINKRKINVPNSMDLGGETYQLRSVVYSEVNVEVDGTETDTVIGSSTLIRVQTPTGDRFLCYDPYGPVHATDAANRRPIQQLPADGQTKDDISFNKLASERGTVFIYATTKKSDFNKVTSVTVN